VCRAHQRRSRVAAAAVATSRVSLWTRRGYLYAPQSAADFGATHAWSEVYLPGAGWKGFDPTFGELASDKHIGVAIGRVADAVPPISGTFFGPMGASMSVAVWVRELP
jgi:transglutaminase-like putative cysteine protease